MKKLIAPALVLAIMALVIPSLAFAQSPKNRRSQNSGVQHSKRSQDPIKKIYNQGPQRSEKRVDRRGADQGRKINKAGPNREHRSKVSRRGQDRDRRLQRPPKHRPDPPRRQARHHRPRPDREVVYVPSQPETVYYPVSEPVYVPLQVYSEPVPSFNLSIGDGNGVGFSIGFGGF